MITHKGDPALGSNNKAKKVSNGRHQIKMFVRKFSNFQNENAHPELLDPKEALFIKEPGIGAAVSLE